MRLQIHLVLTIMLGAGGCTVDDDDVDDRPSRPGELGAGDFIYVCVGDADPFCANGEVADTFPERIAVGARFGLDFDPDDSIFSDGVALRIDAPNKSVVRRELDAYFIQQPGYQVFFAVSNDSEVYDIQHLLAADIDRIAVRTMDSEDLDTIELAVGERVTVSAVPQDALRSTLAGSLDYTWSSQDEAIADVVTVDEDFDVTVEAFDVGTTTLTIETASGFTQQVMLEVRGEDDTTTGMQEGESSSGSSGADTDTDGSTGA